MLLHKQSPSNIPHTIHHSVVQKLHNIMQAKKTNLVVAADYTTSQEILDLVDQVGPHSAVLKLHVDIITDFSNFFIKELRQKADQYNFLLFEDRKFADIGKTVQYQFRNGIYKIAEWADIINAHALAGQAAITALKEVTIRATGLLLVAQMSSKDNLLTPEYTKAVVAMAQNNPDFVIGFICQEQLLENPAIIHMTPGVQLADKKDHLGQQYNTPEYVIETKKTDLIIVGRGITQADNRKEAAQLYQEAGWHSLQKRKKL